MNASAVLLLVVQVSTGDNRTLDVKLTDGADGAQDVVVRRVGDPQPGANACANVEGGYIGMRAAVGEEG